MIHLTQKTRKMHKQETKSGRKKLTKVPSTFHADEDVRTLIEVHKELGGVLTTVINRALREELPIEIQKLLEERRKSTRSLVEKWNSVTPLDDPVAWQEEKIARSAASEGEKLAEEVKQYSRKRDLAKAALGLSGSLTDEQIRKLLARLEEKAPSEGATVVYKQKSALGKSALTKILGLILDEQAETSKPLLIDAPDEPSESSPPSSPSTPQEPV